MLRLPCLLLILTGLAGCHGLFGARTTDEDQEKNRFAEARQRAATYYDGGDYVRAAAQYQKALEIRPDHFPTRLAYAYSLMYTKDPTNLLRAQNEFEDIRRRKDLGQEVKRIYGLAVTHRTLAARLQAQALYHDQKGMIEWATRDVQLARKHATTSLELFDKIFEYDEKLSSKQAVAPMRVSASLTPDAHAGMAHCEIILADKEHLDHLDRAVQHIQAFSEIAERARRFWSERRERILMTDPVREEEMGNPDSNTARGQERVLYEKRIASTIDQEVAMRRSLVEVYIQMERPEDVISECDKILKLAPEFDRAYWLRGQAYASLDPPDYRAALNDLEEFRKLQSLEEGLTETMVRLNRWIKKYEEELAKQKKG